MEFTVLNQWLIVKPKGSFSWWRGRSAIAYRNQSTFSIENKIVRKAQWMESATAILIETGWKLEMLHSSVMKKE